MTPTCRHCHDRPATRARGLCCLCYADKAIRAKYAPLRVIRPQPQTMAELDAMIAEGLANKPDWWSEPDDN